MGYRTRWGLALLLLSLPALQPWPGYAQADGPVVINEILAHTDDPLVDSVELHNPAAQPVDVGGWCLGDDLPCPASGRLPAGTVIPAHGYLVIETEPLGFRLSEDGERVTLTAPTGATHSVEFDASPNGVSLGRVVTSDGKEHFALQSRLTLGGPNAGPRSSSLRIAEIMYNPAGGQPEYVAIANVGTTSMPLYDPARPHLVWEVDGIGALTLPSGLELAPGESLYLTNVTPAAFRAAHALPATVQVFGPYDGQLQDGGETVALLQPGAPNNDGTTDLPIAVDAVTYDDSAPWPVAPDGGGPALQRVPPALPQRWDGFGQEPANWRVAPLPLGQSAPAPEAVRLRVIPQATGWLLAWSSVSEARVSGWRLWRAADGVRANAVPVGEGAGGSLVVAQGGRHVGGHYQQPDRAADRDIAYTYWLEASGDGGTVVAATAVAPTHSLFLPAAQRP